MNDITADAWAKLIGVLLMVCVIVAIWAYGPSPIFAPLDQGEGDLVLFMEEITAEQLPPTQKELCKTNTIMAGSLQFCYEDTHCNLNDEEMVQLYLTGKAALMACKAAQISQMMENIEQMVGEPADDGVSEKWDEYLKANPDLFYRDWPDSEEIPEDLL